MRLNGDVAQLGERRVRNAKVEGSNPFVSISYKSRRRNSERPTDGEIRNVILGSPNVRRGRLGLQSRALHFPFVRRT